jgi:transposase-like protein
MAKKLTFDDLQNKINKLSLNYILALLKSYSNANGVDLTSAKNQLITNDLQNRLTLNEINSVCPKCGSKYIVRYGRNGNTKRFRCNSCNKTFTLFTDTILEKTNYHWDIWVKVVEMTLNNIPMEHMRQVLIDDYHLTSINYKTIFLWKHKIIHAIAKMPMPKLSGTVQVDETFFRESQKGSRHLISTIKGEDRKPRYGRKPSKYGVMGNEFANVTVATDLNGYCVSRVVGLGKLTVDTFTDLFDSYMNKPSFICSDGNSVYKDYCKLKEIPLYIKPSNYVKTLETAGYDSVNWNNSTSAKKVEEVNFKILTKLYNQGLIDHIYNRKDLSYKSFSGIKNANSLSLARVNQFHSELKAHIEATNRNVSTKYLADYVGFYTFIRNWKVSHNHYPTSKKDAERILIDILRGHTSYTTTNMKCAVIEFPKASDKYMAMLKAKTAEIRKLTKNPYFKYDADDHVESFDRRNYLSDLPTYKLEKLCTKYKISHKWAKYSKISALLKKQTIGDDILLLIMESKTDPISEEDRQAIQAKQFIS